jgi:signal peptidase I
MWRLVLSFASGIATWFVAHLFSTDAKVVFGAAFLVFLVFLFVISYLIFPSPRPAQKSATAEKQAPAHQPADSTREIVETVVFVVVLVLLLKSFAAEAFVIPTGSMAETLWGYQKVVECPECKHQFPINASQEADAQDRDPDKLIPMIGGVCPNCGKPILFSGHDQDRRAAFAVSRFKEKYHDYVEIPDPGWTSGDRVLVAKFLYELLGTMPNRLDVVVFKFPGDEGGGHTWPNTGPQKNHVPINYIKRLIGLPGEIIAIKGGKIYVLAADKVPAAQRQQFDDLAGLSGPEREEMRLQLWRSEHMHANKAPFDPGKYRIVKKPADVILSMERIVCDNDRQAGDLPKSKQRWRPTDEWKAEGENGFEHKAETPGLHMLRYRHVLRGPSDEPQLIADAMGYNTNSPAQNGDVAAGRWCGDNWVGDLILECDLVVEKPEGKFILELSRSADRFQAVWDLASGRCSLWRIHNGTEEETPLGSVETKVKKGTYHLRFANVDRRLTVWVDNRVVEWSGGAQGVDYETPDTDADLPKKNDLEPASIGADGAAVRVQKIKLWRDTYYTVSASEPDFGRIPESEWSDPDAWKSRTVPFKTLYVQPGHFLCMGDNSPQSSDGRNWGLVPERLLLGRAQLVYYPFYFPWWPLNSQVNRLQVIR